VNPHGIFLVRNSNPEVLLIPICSSFLSTKNCVLEGGMTLYCKAGPEGLGQIGDCPFCHFVRLVLEEKGLEYELRPATQATKPQWLVDHYEGKMPALRHKKECYVESDVIAGYLDFFFVKDAGGEKGSKDVEVAAQAILDGFFPTVAKYLKHTPDGDETDGELRGDLERKLEALNKHLQSLGENKLVTGVPAAQRLSVIDCKLAPQLYHCIVGVETFKDWTVRESYPAVQAYVDAIKSRPSWKATEYPASTVIWGWSSGRQ
jgi:glutathione S-transferase